MYYAYTLVLLFKHNTTYIYIYIYILTYTYMHMYSFLLFEPKFHHLAATCKIIGTFQRFLTAFGTSLLLNPVGACFIYFASCSTVTEFSASFLQHIIIMMIIVL